MNLDRFAAATGTQVRGEGKLAARVDRIRTNSTEVEAGDLFIALKGERFDGNEFIDDAVARGAAAVVCDEGRAPERRDVAFLEVRDTLRALGDIAAEYRSQFSGPVAAVTGSNGKTTTKELLRAVLVEHHGDPSKVLATEGNLNNLIGVPLTLFGLAPVHRVAVVEMGMNAFGEIARLTEIASPTVGVITCVGAAHLEGLGSIEGVARAKGELFAGLDAGATAVINADDPQVMAVSADVGARRLYFGEGRDVRAEDVEVVGFEATRFRLVTPAGQATVLMPLMGRHNVTNALAAAAVATVLEVAPEAIAAGLERVELPPMRLAAERLANGVTVINDAYNANPDSVVAAIATLAESAPGRKIVVLGEMLELGPGAAAMHAEVGAAAAGVDPVLLCAVGPHAEDVRRGATEAGMSPERAIAATSHEIAAAEVERAWRRDDTVLVKGSRGSRMETVIETLKRSAAT
jgi:UDP-N-acetylmuramoyl-tripeptide--D-alanyl-D-alanine ligase